MTTEKLVCIECEEELDPNDGYRWTEDGPLCYACEQCEFERASTLVQFALGVGEDGGNKRTAKITDHFTVDPEYFEEVDWPQDVVKPRRWVATDGWRGYFETELRGGYTELADGWATGRYSDVPWKHRVQDLGEALERGDFVPPGQGLFVLLEPTSNIFSLATTFFCSCDDEEAVKACLLENGFGVEVLDRALS